MAFTAPIVGHFPAQIEVETVVPTAEPNQKIFHLHSIHTERRLTDRTRVLDDLLVTKFDGYFGDREFIWIPGGMLAAPALA